MRFNRHSLALAVHWIAGGALLGAATPGLAQDTTPREPELTVIHVIGVDEDAAQVVAPFNVLDRQAVFARSAATLGALLDGIPGVHADTFGAGASRPVIRGQTSPRVAILSDGAGLLDASDISPDHAVTMDPLLTRRVEVLRGPATLLYGSGAVGGVVNVLDDRIPTAVPEAGDEGFLSLRGNTVAGERAGALSMTLRAADNVALHAEGSMREADDYKMPGQRESRVDGTWTESANGSLGASWVGERGYLGLAYSYRDDDYGLPGHSHEYESCHPHGSALHCGGHESGGEDHDHGHDHDHDHDHAAAPAVDLASRRIDLRGEYREPFAGVHRLRLRLSHSDYEHHEIDEGVISTTFRNEGYEGRVELDHAPLFGWHGVTGVQFSDTEFAALGAEAFIPETRSRSFGIFLVEHYQLNDRLHFEAGARYERQKHDPVNDARNRPAFDDSALSFSLAGIWEFSPGHRLALSLADAERLPHAQELYARGVHLATNTYECGLVPHPLTCGGEENNAPFGKESSRNVELSLRGGGGPLGYALSVFDNAVDDYIYARTLDRHEDFRLVKYTQRDAGFTGIEAELSYRFSPLLSATLFGDRVRARFDAGGNLPRISPARAGLRVNVDTGRLGVALEYFHVDRQDDVAAYETPTPGYDMLNATLSFSPFADERHSLFLRAGNLLDEQVWNHSSFLAHTVPLPGRNLSMGFQVGF